MYNYQVVYVAEATGYKAFGICTVTVPSLILSVDDECLKVATKFKLAKKFEKCEFEFVITILGFQACNKIH